MTFLSSEPECSRRLRFWTYAAGAVLALVFSACGSKVPDTHYYRLELPPPPRAQEQPLDKTALVMDLRASRMLSQDRIVYRPTQQEVGFYEYHRWAELPETMFTNALLEYLRAQSLFKSVAPFDGRTQGDYIIRGRIERLEEVDFQGGVSVRVKLAAQLVDAETRQAVWSGEGEGGGDVTVGDVHAVVEQMNAAAEESIRELVAGMGDFLRSSESRSAAASSEPPPETQN